jgi:signal transduction histidine kinase
MKQKVSETGHEGTILIVDDNARNLDLLRLLFVQEGYEVRLAASGDSALQEVAAQLPDLILMDVRMQGLDGYATCERLKANETTRDIPVIFISGLGGDADRIAAFKAGGVDYVSKPFYAEEVLSRVRAHINLRHDRSRLEAMVSIRTRELAESEMHLRRLSISLQRIREQDRAHFARELHDELGQDLTALRIEFDRLASELGTVGPVGAERLAGIDRMIERTVEATRRICEELRPGMLDNLGLEAALANYTKGFSRQFGISCDLALDREDYGLGDALATAIFRIVQEALTNVARHAQASHAMVDLQECGDELILTIADDGRGLPVDLPESRKTYGLLGIRERVGMLGGRLSIDSSPGRGTHLEVAIPHRQKEDA